MNSNTIVLAPQGTRFYYEQTMKLNEMPTSDYQIKILNNEQSQRVALERSNNRFYIEKERPIFEFPCSVLKPKCLRSYNPFDEWQGTEKINNNNFDDLLVDDNRSSNILDKPYDWVTGCSDDRSTDKDCDTTSNDCEFFGSPQRFSRELLDVQYDSREMPYYAYQDDEDQGLDTRTIVTSKTVGFLVY